MLDTISIQVAQRGVISLPKALRKTYQLKPGDTLTLLDLGGVFVLSPRSSEIDALAGKITRKLAARGETLESMLKALRKAREARGGKS